MNMLEGTSVEIKGYNVAALFWGYVLLVALFEKFGWWS